MKIRLTWLLACLVAPSVCYAQGPDQEHAVAKDAEAYCNYVKGVAHSLSALELLPRAFGTAGVLDGVLAPGATITQSTTTQIIVGGTYSLTGIYRGISINGQASAECERYRAESGLHAFVESNRLGLSVTALKAKAAILDEALHHAEDLLKEQQMLMGMSRTTLEILEATQLRLDELHDLAEQTHKDLESLESAPIPPPESIHGLIRKHDELEGEVERYNSRIREANGWDLSVRGGYDQIFNSVSYGFVSATLTVSLGWPFQFGPDSTAIENRPIWIRRQIEGADDRVTQLTSVLRAELRSEEARLRETTILMNDLEQRYKATAQIPGDVAKRAADALWFDLVKVKAQHEYYVVHVRDLRVALTDEQGKAAP